MKKTILQTSIILLLFVLPSSSKAQVTITESSFPRMAGFIDTVHRVTLAGISLPSEGPDQVWDYSSLGLGEEGAFELFDARNDTSIFDALNFFMENLSFQGFIVPRYAYDALDEEGWFRTGVITKDAVYSIATISGGANDSLRFPASAMNFDNTIDLVQFPMTYLDKWTQFNIENTNFELSIAAFGLDKTPGYQQRKISNDREVVAYGTLKIPTKDGTASAPMDVLLLSVKQITQDSFFLGGAPAPPAILGAFGLTQGAIARDSFYVFYRPGFGGPVLNINLTIDDHFYRPQAADISTAVHKVSRLAPLRFSPNPAVAGTSLQVQIEHPVSSGYVKFMDTSGRLLHQQAFEALTANQFEVQVPSEMNAGMYIYQVYGKQGNLIAADKLILH